ncbi:unnamed protein product, partial [Cyprideis torosa]
GRARSLSSRIVRAARGIQTPSSSSSSLPRFTPNRTVGPERQRILDDLYGGHRHLCKQMNLPCRPPLPHRNDRLLPVRPRKPVNVDKYLIRRNLTPCRLAIPTVIDIEEYMAKGLPVSVTFELYKRHSGTVRMRLISISPTAEEDSEDDGQTFTIKELDGLRYSSEVCTDGSNGEEELVEEANLTDEKKMAARRKRT